MRAIIVAVVDEKSSADLWWTAVKLASDRDSRLILYDIDAPAMVTTSTPLEASEVNDDPLNASELDHLGRWELAKQVKTAREQGIDTWGWLPDSAKPQALVDYLEALGAATVVVPRHMTDQTWYQRLQGLTSAHIQEAAGQLEVVLVGEAPDEVSD
jgi:hypothetical protein